LELLLQQPSLPNRPFGVGLCWIKEETNNVNLYLRV
jgi:hypothetical protein